jgi:hypothetical protein
VVGYVLKRPLKKRMPRCSFHNVIGGLDCEVKYCGKRQDFWVPSSALFGIVVIAHAQMPDRQLRCAGNSESIQFQEYAVPCW